MVWQALSLHRVGFVVLDEADKLLELGFAQVPLPRLADRI